MFVLYFRGYKTCFLTPLWRGDGKKVSSIKKKQFRGAFKTKNVTNCGKSPRGCSDIKIVYISNFFQFRSRGGQQKSIFSEIQNIICDIFSFEGSPNQAKF